MSGMGNRSMAARRVSFARASGGKHQRYSDVHLDVMRSGASAAVIKATQDSCGSDGFNFSGNSAFHVGDSFRTVDVQ